MKRNIFLSFITAVSMLTGVASAAEKTSCPVFRLETGMHTAMVRAVAADREGRFFVTASDDKTVRVWELPSASGPSIGGASTELKLVRVLRPPVGTGHEGKLNAVAVSPDGAAIASGGWTGWNSAGTSSVYLFNRVDGSMSKRISGFPDVIKGLGYSPDGRFLAVTLGGKGGLCVLRTVDWKLLLVDRTYGGDTYGVAFSVDGRIATTSWDGFVRLYGANRKLLARRRLMSGESPHGIDFSRDGRFLAVGSVASPRVEVLSALDLSFLYTPALTGTENGAFSTVAWGGNGELYAAGSCRLKGGFILRRWPETGQGTAEDFAVAASDILALAPLADGSIAYACAVPETGVVSPNGVVAFKRRGDTVDFRYTQPDFRLSADGSTVQFDFGPPGTPRARFSLADRSLDVSPDTPATGLTLPVINGKGLIAENWLDSTAPALNGLPLALDRFETSRSLAFLPDGRGLVLGTDWHLRCFDRYGKSLWRVSAPGIAWAVNVSADGRLVVAAFGDGTIRWYRAADGAELLVLFPHADRKRWLLRTPSGYYDSSPGGEDLAGWHLDNGADRAADFFPVSRLRAYYYRPDVIGGVFSSADESEAVRRADLASGRTTRPGMITEYLPPVVVLHAPSDRSASNEQVVDVSFSIRTPSGEAVTGVRVMVNGRPARFTGGENPGGSGNVRTVRVPIDPGESEIAIIAENRHAVSEPAIIRVTSSVAAPLEVISFKPRLLILAVGIGDYREKELALDFAAKDARDFVGIMLGQKGQLYSDVVVRTLTDAAATRDAIVDGLNWLRTESSARDTAVVFLSGHGITLANGNYYFLPVNGTFSDPARNGLIFSELRNTLMTLPGRAVLFIDTCHAGDVLGRNNGAAMMTGVVNELSAVENGVVVFASSTGSQISVEDNAWGNGAFTKAVVEGLGGRADFTGKGRITIAALDLWLSERVRELTDGKQTPATAKPRTVPDFPLALKK